MDDTFAEAEHQLSELIDRAIAGEGVVITRDGKPVAALRAMPDPFPEGRPITQASIDWLVHHRVGKIIPDEDAVSIVRKMREEGTD
jgi:antitoxin (DNA-binding transcriptional repressor) of toxin-antitoxin stability system